MMNENKVKILYISTQPLTVNTSSTIRNKALLKGFLLNKIQVDILVFKNGKFVIEKYNEHISHHTNNFSTKKINFRNGLNNNLLVKKLKIKIYRSISRRRVYDKYYKQINNLEWTKNLAEYTHIISSSDPKSSHKLASQIKEKYPQILWVQIWGDPWTNDITQDRTKVLKKINIEEKKLLTASDFIFYVSDLTLEKQKEIFPELSHKMYSTFIPFLRRNESQNKKIKNNGKLTFLYAGDYNSNIRNIKPLYDSFLRTEHKLVICGNSDINLQCTENITIIPRIEENELKKIERNSDVLIHLSNLKGTQIPGKIYQYSGTTKPIIFLLDGNFEAIYNLFNRFNRYIFCYNNKESISSLLLKKEEFKETKVVEEFSPQIVVKNILLAIAKNK
ncbi:hypothetical protein HQ929_12630 [Enterococcus faecium]|nr:hypothetical protein [Enterococcus faecium]MDQ8525204.1 hypothetical protein [Enterococcus faecium]NTR21062.1 hypothetical protein [Enterococcus faecium]